MFRQLFKALEPCRNMLVSIKIFFCTKHSLIILYYLNCYIFGIFYKWILYFNLINEYFQSRAVGGNGNAFQQNCVSREQKLTEVLKKSLPGITYISVDDISGGCGAMFEVFSILFHTALHK